jgi:hypothetical protein
MEELKMVSRYKKSGGWFSESSRHSLSAKGVKTGRKIDYGLFSKSEIESVVDRLQKSKKYAWMQDNYNDYNDMIDDFDKLSDEGWVLITINSEGDFIFRKNENNKIAYAKSNLSKSLDSLPTLATGQADDLKIDTGNRRVWVSRVDGSVSVERLKNGRWEIVDDDIDYSLFPIPVGIKVRDVGDELDDIDAVIKKKGKDVARQRLEKMKVELQDYKIYAEKLKEDDTGFLSLPSDEPSDLVQIKTLQKRIDSKIKSIGGR